MRKKSLFKVYAARMILFLITFTMLFTVISVSFWLSLHISFNKKEMFAPGGFKVLAATVKNTVTVNVELDENTVPQTVDLMDFKADLSEYEKYMVPEDPDEYLVLINIDNPLDETYKPDDLINVVDTRKDGRAVQQLREYAAKALEALLTEARANGFNDITVTSAYRSFDYQTTLFTQRVAMYSHLPYDEAYAAAAKIVAIPGTSEHQSGLCLDMHNISTGADVSFANTEQGKWLAENSYKFGFILRFPEDKTDITGISFEPWHFRYVGRYHATQMYDLGLCFEEYMDHLDS